MINLEDLQVRPHPYKKILKKHGVSIAMTAKYLGLTYAYVWGMLSGSYKMSRPVEKKLRLLVNQLQGVVPA